MLENNKKREKKAVKILALVTILSVICCITLVIITAHKPDSPEFCARCHSMGSSYNTWKETVSCKTGCLGCHTHDNSSRTLSVEIEDSSCTNTDCHPAEKLTSKLSKYKEAISFNHKTHLKGFPTNLKLRCTGCHSRVDGGIKKEAEERHFSIDENACFICHFIEGETPMLTGDKKRVDECSLCHKDVQVKVMIYKKEFDHLMYEKELKVECTNCHFKIIHRGNNVEKKSCYYCHTKLPDGYEGVDRMHSDHVEKHKVLCSTCHDETLHKWEDEYVNNILPTRDSYDRDKYLIRDSKISEDVKPDNRKDKEDVFAEGSYLLQKNVYAGYGGRGVEKSPDPMYLATVNCIACHKDKDLSVDPSTCNTCHEKGFDKTMAEQKEYIKSRLGSLSELLKKNTNRDVTKASIDEARYNYDLIIGDGSLGAHNIKYVKDLINYSIKQLQPENEHE